MYAITTAARTMARRARIPQAFATVQRGYHDNIVERFENPRNVGAMNKNDDNVGTVCVIPLPPVFSK